MNFVTNLLNGVVSLIFKVLIFISNLLLTPIITIVNNIFPSVDFSYITSLLNDYLVNYIGFFKTVFLNLSGVNVALFNTFILFFFTRLGLRVSVRAIKLIKNIWSLFRRGQTD